MGFLFLGIHINCLSPLWESRSAVSFPEQCTSVINGPVLFASKFFVLSKCSYVIESHSPHWFFEGFFNSRCEVLLTSNKCSPLLNNVPSVVLEITVGILSCNHSHCLLESGLQNITSCLGLFCLCLEFRFSWRMQVWVMQIHLLHLFPFHGFVFEVSVCLFDSWFHHEVLKSRFDHSELVATPLVNRSSDHHIGMLHEFNGVSPLVKSPGWLSVEPSGEVIRHNCLALLCEFSVQISILTALLLHSVYFVTKDSIQLIKLFRVEILLCSQ